MILCVSYLTKKCIVSWECLWEKTLEVSAITNNEAILQIILLNDTIIFKKTRIFAVQ